MSRSYESGSGAGAAQEPPPPLHLTPFNGMRENSGVEICDPNPV
jgi:hypothetical protein